MNELTIEPKSHVIMTWNKTEHFITQKQHNIVINLGLQDKIIVDGNLIFGKSIAEILTLDNFYKNFPDKRPQQELKPFDFKTISQTMNGFSKERRKKALESMRSGFLTVFNGEPTTSSAKSILKDMNFRIDTIDW